MASSGVRVTGAAADMGLVQSATVNPGNRRGGDSAELARRGDVLEFPRDSHPCRSIRDVLVPPRRHARLVSCLREAVGRWLAKLDTIAATHSRPIAAAKR